MSVEVGAYLFYFLVFFFLGAMSSLGAIFLMHFFVPKKLLQEYFRPPYFKEGEILAFTGFPLGYIRTVMFMRLVAYPNSGKKRGLTKAYEMAPFWFRHLSRVILLFFVSFVGLFFVLLVFLYIDATFWRPTEIAL